MFLSMVLNRDSSKGTADLYQWKDQKSSLISDAVWSFVPQNDGSVVVLKNYDQTTYTGDLCIWRKGGFW